MLFDWFVLGAHLCFWFSNLCSLNISGANGDVPWFTISGFSCQRMSLRVSCVHEAGSGFGFLLCSGGMCRRQAGRWDGKDAKSYSRSLGGEKWTVWRENASTMLVVFCVCVEEVCFSPESTGTRRECWSVCVIPGIGKWYICGCYWTIHCWSGQTLSRVLNFWRLPLAILLLICCNSCLCTDLKNCVALQFARVGGWVCFWLQGSTLFLSQLL